MFDATLRPLIDPPLRRIAKVLDGAGLSPNNLTWTGLGLGLLAVPALWQGLYLVALVLIGLNRLFDGLDGALARLWRERGKPPPIEGGVFDISADFIFYGAIPLGFALADPATNALAAAFLLAAFLGTGSSFLAFAILAAQHGLETESHGSKAFYYLGGLAEGTETIGLFIAACLLPQWFPWLALGYGLICWMSVLGRFFLIREKVKALNP